VPKGIDQVVEAAQLCRDAAAGLEDQSAELRARVEALAERLESLRTKFFLRMGPAVRYSAACLEAAQSVREAIAAGETADALGAKVDALDAATTTLDDRANAAGNMTIT
jgi:hypothetical protein